MPVKLSTTLEKIGKIENAQNHFLVIQYHKYMDSTKDNLEKIVLGEFFATPIARIGQYLKW